jgi:hypothetical protein
MRPELPVAHTPGERVQQPVSHRLGPARHALATIAHSRRSAVRHRRPLRYPHCYYHRPPHLPPENRRWRSGRYIPGRMGRPAVNPRAGG